MLEKSGTHSSTCCRLPIVVPVTASLLLTFGALFWHGRWSLAALTFGVVLLAIAVKAHRHSWKRVGLLLVWQVTFVMALYGLRFGVEKLDEGALVAYRMALLLLPGLLVLKALHHGEISRLIMRLLPARLGFVLSTCVFFFPTLWAVMMQIYESQVLNGARILPRELLNPLNWITLVRVICLPAIVTSLALARDIALAAHCRWYGLYSERTVWPGPNGEPHA
jgi:energy-coupling factor transport system permease protein